MSDYTKTTNFTAKDSLVTGDPSKKVLGSEHDAEYTAIATAIATKADDDAVVHDTGNEAVAGNKTLSGTLTMSGKSIVDANASVAAHATTSDIWSAGNYVTLTGAVLTFTDFADAPQAGAEVELYCNDAHVFTHNANLLIDGAVNFTAAAGDRVRVRAKSTSVFTLHPVLIAGFTASQGASLVLLDAQTIAAAASVSVTSKITSVYDDYLWIGENIIFTNDNNTLTFAVSTDNNATQDAQNKYWSGVPNAAMSGPTTTYTKSGLNNSTTIPMSFTMQFFNPMSTTVSKQWNWKGRVPLTVTGVVNTFDQDGMWNVPGTAVNAFKLTSDTTMSGTFKLYGIRKA